MAPPDCPTFTQNVYSIQVQPKFDADHFSLSVTRQVSRSKPRQERAGKEEEETKGKQERLEGRTTTDRRRGDPRGAMVVELRAFQREILDLARERNVVMVGETGIGKTFLAIALLLEQDYADGRRAFFMAPTRQLVVQITAKIRQMSTLRVNSYCGGAGDLWDARQWARELELNRVFVCTPEVVRNVLQKGYVLLEQMNLLVFDECHHVTKRHPYAQVVKMYNDADPAAMPRIFGTTACPTKLCAENLRAVLKKVELDQLQVKEFAAASPLVYETYPAQQPWALAVSSASESEEAASDSAHLASGAHWLFSNLMAELQEVKAIEVFEKLVKKGKSDAAIDIDKRDKVKKKFVQNCLTIYKNLGPWCYYRFVELEINRLAISASLMITIPGSIYGLDQDAVKTMLLLRSKRAACNFACTNKVDKVEEIVRTRLLSNSIIDSTADAIPPAAVPDADDEGDGEGGGDAEATDGSSSDDAEAPDSPTNTDSADRPLQGILFVNTRTECRVLTDFLNEKLSPDLSEDADAETQPESERPQLFACILGGASRNDTASFCLPKMERTLNDFETGAVRVLVSTSVSVEGVDFPQCALIVVMDKVNTARALIQLRGRARHEDGVVYYLGEHGDLSQHISLQNLLKEAEVINRLEFSKEKAETTAQQPRSVMAKAIGLGDNKIVIESTGAVLDLDSAIPCINMFCQSLPARQYTVDVKRMYKFTELRHASRPLFVAELTLPVELNLPPVESEPMPSKAGAKSLAAFIACRQLVERGELDESFNSVYRSAKAKAAANVQDLSYFISRLHT